MIEPSKILALQAQALVGLLRRDEASACEREAQLAADRARETVRAAYREARRLVREAVQEERSRREVALLQARAAVETRRRQAAQREASRVVRVAWTCLPGALQSLWNEADLRAAWCRAAIVAAARVLQLDRWEIDCAAATPQAEVERLCEWARAAGVRAVTARCREGLAAGVAIRSAGATFDATHAGLLSARDAIEAELHAEWLAEAMR
jgi:hypothetical protein